MKSLILLIPVIFIIKICAFPSYDEKIKQAIGDDGPGEPLILTPFIEQNKIEEARSAAAVHFYDFKDVKSYSGYFTVNKNFNSNMFFWFFPSQTNYTTDPVVVWLQGGPGASSLLGLFNEHGPFRVTSKKEIEMREYSWTKSHSVIYIDSPVGTGCSFTDKGGYAQNETKVGEDLYNALQQFFLLFPELQKNDFFVTGESYGGKYVPALSYTIHKNNPSAKIKINLKGLAIGNGYSDPINQLNYGDYLFQLGLIDSNARDSFKSLEAKCVKFIEQEDYQKAFGMLDIIIYGAVIKKTLFNNATGFQNRYNYLYSIDPDTEPSKNMQEYLNQVKVRAAIHIGNTTFGDSEVNKNLRSDIMRSVAPWISELLNYYRVLIYNGQLDVIVGYPLTVNFLQKLKFSAADEYKKAPRQIWRVGNDIAGYAKTAGNLTEVLVRNSGHLVPADQPQWAQDLITRFTQNKLFN